VSGDDNGVIDGNGYVGGGKGNGAAGIALLSHGDEGGGGEVGDNVNATGSGREHRQVEVGFMGRFHDSTIGVLANGNRIEARSFVNNRSIDGTKWAVLPVSAMASWWGVVKLGGPMAIGASSVDTN
jgi:hypothetical protein